MIFTHENYLHKNEKPRSFCAHEKVESKFAQICVLVVGKMKNQILKTALEIDIIFGLGFKIYGHYSRWVWGSNCPVSNLAVEIIYPLGGVISQ